MAIDARTKERAVTTRKMQAEADAKQGGHNLSKWVTRPDGKSAQASCRNEGCQGHVAISLEQYGNIVPSGTRDQTCPYQSRANVRR